MNMTTEIAKKIIEEIERDVERLSDFCHYNRMCEEVTFMENATEIFKKHLDLNDEEIMTIRVAMSIGYDAGKRKRATSESR